MLLTVVRLLLLAEDNFESSPQFSHGHVVLKAELVKFCSGMLPLQSGKSLSFLSEFSWEENSNKQEHTINMNYVIDKTIPNKPRYNIVCIHTAYLVACLSGPAPLRDEYLRDCRTLFFSGKGAALSIPAGVEGLLDL